MTFPLFKGRQCKISIKSLRVNGVALQCVDSVMDLGHAVSSNDKDSIVTAAKASFSVFLIYSCLTLVTYSHF